MNAGNSKGADCHLRIHASCSSVPPPPSLGPCVVSNFYPHTDLLSDSWLVAGSSPHSISKNINSHLNSGCSATQTNFMVIASSFPKSDQFWGWPPTALVFWPRARLSLGLTSPKSLSSQATSGREPQQGGAWSPGRVIPLWCKPNHHASPVHYVRTHTQTHTHTLLLLLNIVMMVKIIFVLLCMLTYNPLWFPSCVNLFYFYFFIIYFFIFSCVNLIKARENKMSLYQKYNCPLG